MHTLLFNSSNFTCKHRHGLQCTFDRSSLHVGFSNYHGLQGLAHSSYVSSLSACFSACFKRASHLASSSADSWRRYSSVFCSSSSRLSCCRRLLVSCTDSDHSLVESCRSDLALVQGPVHQHIVLNVYT